MILNLQSRPNTDASCSRNWHIPIGMEGRVYKGCKGYGKRVKSNLEDSLFQDGFPSLPSGQAFREEDGRIMGVSLTMDHE